MEQIKNIYHLQNTINRNTHYFLRPKNAALSTLLEPYLIQDFGGVSINQQSQLPKLRNLSQQQILLDIESKRRLSVQNLQKLSSQRYLNKLMRSQTIDEPALRKSNEIIQSCEKIIRDYRNNQPEIRVKVKNDDEYKAIRKADILHKLIKDQIYKSSKDDLQHQNKKAISYIREETIRLDKDKFIQRCNREKFQLQQFREKPRKEKEFKRFRTNYHDLDI